ncbi:hypothetical protein FACS18947_4040 [Bacteroidia bacterium]|nr:hypothetical protein FACS18947_4040 [Bacteroidia bacterium]
MAQATLSGPDGAIHLVRDREASVSSAGRGFKPIAPKKPGLLIDIQSKLRQYGVPAKSQDFVGKGGAKERGSFRALLGSEHSVFRDDAGEGYRRWATVFNLKQAAQTLIYLQEHGLDDYAALKEKTEAASARYHDLSARIKGLEEQLAANASLQKHIINYSRTRSIYEAYRKAGYSKKFRAGHAEDILLHQAAKQVFDDLGYSRDRRLPTIKTLRAEYAAALDEKKKAYAGYREAKDEMRALLTAKQNVDRLLNIPDERRGREPERTDL